MGPQELYDILEESTGGEEAIESEIATALDGIKDGPLAGAEAVLDGDGVLLKINGMRYRVAVLLES